MRFVLCCVGLVLVAGCVPVTATPRSVALLSIDATQQAAADQARLEAEAAVATQQALETQMALSDELGELQITAQALEIERAERAQALADEMAVLDRRRQEMELEERAAMLPLTQVAGDATATAIVAESMERVSRREQAEVLATLVPVLLCVAGFTLIGAAGYGLVTAVRVWNDRQRMVETSLGPMLILPAGGWENLGLLDPIEAVPQLPAQRQTSPQVWTTPGGSTAFSTRVGSNGHRPQVDDHTLVRNFLRHAAAGGPLETQFPRWDSMGWHSDQWKRAMGILKSEGLAYSKDREGSWVNTERYPNIGALNAAVHSRQVGL